MSLDYALSPQINLHVKDRISAEDARRQTETARDILGRLRTQPGLIVADEVGMGKTFVALAVATSVVLSDPEQRPVVIMVPPSLREKWPGDFAVFREMCLPPDIAIGLRSAAADRAIDFLKLLDDPPERRKNIIFMTHGAMSRGMRDGWLKLALVQRALKGRHSIGNLRRALCRTMGSLLQMGWVHYQDPSVWGKLLATPPADWLAVLRRHGIDPENDDNPKTDDDPVPQTVIDVFEDLNTDEMFAALQRIPYRESKHFEERVAHARWRITEQLKELWAKCVARLHFHLPLLVLDEAHHLKNEKTRLASLFHVPDAEEDAQEVSDRGALGGVFERMLFLTATPFQLGHGELCSVLERFGGISWEGDRAPPCGKARFEKDLHELRSLLDKAQESAITLDHAWSLLRTDDLATEGKACSDMEAWWAAVRGGAARSSQTQRVLTCYTRAHEAMRQAEQALRPWVIRHLKPRNLPHPYEHVPRRRRLVGRAIVDDTDLPDAPGIEVHGRALLPFLLAARATACAPDSRPVFAEGLASSYEAFLHTRMQREQGQAAGFAAPTDIDDDLGDACVIDEVGAWYLDQLATLLPQDDAGASASHPKIAATVNRVVNIWHRGEKVVVFCHYIATGKTLRRRISEAITSEINRLAAEKLGCSPERAEGELERLGKRFFDMVSPARRACATEVSRILDQFRDLDAFREQLTEVVRRYVRTPSFLARYFPLKDGSLGRESVIRAFDECDASQLCLRRLLEHFFEFLVRRCGGDDRQRYIDAVSQVQTGSHAGRDAVGSFSSDELDDLRDSRGAMIVPNVRLVNGATRQETRQRLMLTFNTPFYPEVLVASSVMAEGVDLQMNCRFVVHHDLCWNPSTLEQRTGRIDRIGAKAERSGQSIHVYLPFIAETQDEKMYRVVMDRERWFSVVMGEQYKVDARTTEKLANRVPFPASAAAELAFRLEVMSRAEGAAASAPA